MPTIHILDLDFLDTEEAIASFLIPTSQGLVLVESGPESTFSHLEKALEKLGYASKDVKAVLLTHIHFDHAGAAWKFAEMGANIYVHPLGLPHLVSPEKLWNSAAMIYGDQMEKLWGKMKNIPESQLIAPKDREIISFGDVSFEAIFTPGHAVHHIAWKMGDIIFTGDVAGVKIENGPVVPPCPPPDIHIEAWKKSLEILVSEKPKALYLTHFGIVTEVDRHLENLSEILDDWANWIKPLFESGTPEKETIPKFMAYTQEQLKSQGCGPELIKVYEYANPSWMSVAGLYRYWKLKQQGRL